MHRELLPRIKANLETDGYVAPVVFALLPDDQLRVIALDFKTNGQKRRAYNSVKRHLRWLRAWGALAVNESWVLLGPDAASHLPPSQHPNRREAISVLLQTFGFAESYVLPFERRGKQIVFDREMGPLQAQVFFFDFNEGVQ